MTTEKLWGKNGTGRVLKDQQQKVITWSQDGNNNKMEIKFEINNNNNSNYRNNTENDSNAYE